MRTLTAVLLSCSLLLATFGSALADTPAAAADQPASRAPAATPAPNPPASSVEQLDADALFELGKNLFDNYAPDEIKRDYEFPSRARWDAFVPRLQAALEGNSFEDLAALESEARQALVLLRQFEGTENLQLWLEERLELIEAARDISRPAARPPQTPSRQKPSKPARPTASPGSAPDLPASPSGTKAPAQQAQASRGAETPKPFAPQSPPLEAARPTTGIPNYDYWLARIKDRPAPPSARELMPLLSSCFIDEKSPPALAWLAEVESTFNPSARSPAGACGLYQLMPATAQGLGLSTWMPDDRTHPEKSARAAARLLRSLYLKFGDWPLALAAYNAGEGRIRRLLAKTRTTTFAGIADSLPVETRLYVPKVLATVATRTGISPENL